jgi:hypothetical protein
MFQSDKVKVSRKARILNDEKLGDFCNLMLLWSKACTVYDSLNIEIAGSNPARGMDVCLRVSVLYCPVCR